MRPELPPATPTRHIDSGRPRFHDAGSTLVLKRGRDKDLYPDETSAIVVQALRDALDRADSESRRHHVVKSLLEANDRDQADKLRQQRETLKSILTGYRQMTPAVRRRLTEMGFEITDGRHYKLRYRGDDRYVFTLPTSGSDAHGGLNAAGDISRLLF